MRRTLTVVLLALGLAAPAAVVASPAGGEGPADGESGAPAAEELAVKQARVRREIEDLKREKRRLEREERGLLGRLESLEAEARLLDARVEKLRYDQRATEQALADLGEAQRATEESLAEAQDGLAEIVRLLARIGPLGRVRPALAAGDAERLGAGLRLAHELTRRQRATVETIREKRGDLALLRAEREARETRLAALRAEAEATRSSLGRAIASRRRLLTRIREDAEVRARAIRELERASEELARMIEGQASRAEVELDIRRFRGVLPPPVEGKVLRAFGERRDPRFGTRLPHRGWAMDADYGAPVRAIFDGQVVFADWFRGYGLTVIVDHGRGLHSVYAHLSAIVTPEEMRVEKGELLGRVGDTGSLEGPGLYFEIRSHGKAADPAAWIDR